MSLLVEKSEVIWRVGFRAVRMLHFPRRESSPVQDLPPIRDLPPITISEGKEEHDHREINVSFKPL